MLGGTAANLGRITVATVLLAIWAHGWGRGWEGPGRAWFFLSGVIGFGLGDMALFGALPRIGPRLAILLTQCLATPVAALVEWGWLGTRLGAADYVCAAIILTGVALALAPDRGLEVERRVFWVGVAFGVGSALGQALGAVLSRKAYAVGDLAHFSVDGGTAAYQRILGGLLMTLVAFMALRSMRAGAATTDGAWRQAWPLVLGNALAGPSIGVACYQWALATTPSGTVLPIVATSPLVTQVLSLFLDGSRPTRRAVVGGLLAVAGAVGLALARSG